MLLFKAIKGIYIRWLFKHNKQRLARFSMRKIDKMDGVSFEIYLAALFETLGYKTEATKASNDYGADLLLKKHFKRIAVQAKCYKAHVSVSAVQEAHSAKGYYKAREAWVVTNSNFTRQAVNLAEKLDVLLIDRESLIKLSDKVKENIF